MTNTVSFDRHKLEIFNWPELMQSFGPLTQLCFGAGELPRTLKGEAFTLLSLASGCRHCQAHAGYGLHLQGASTERIQALWDFERSSLFNEAERAVYYFALAAGSSPNAVTPEHFAALRRHFTDRQITELLAVVAISGFLNRYSDTLAVVTDQESVDWASEFLGPVGWSTGKHIGDQSEQRPAFPHAVHKK
ncbi:MAG: carboxymuconolactone decarboxylase family protein [Steroidobacteraceae bacterium]